MATNVYGNGTTTATAGANTIVHYYDRAGVNAANRVNVYQQFVDRKSMPQKYGKTFKISRFEHMYDRSFSDGDFASKGYMTARDIADLNTTLSNATLAEGSGAVNQRSLAKVTYETSFARYGEMIDYTDEVDIWSEDYIQVRYREELGELANARMEDLIQRDMLATSTVLYSGAAGAIGEIGTGAVADGSTDSDHTVSYDLIRRASRKLVRNRAKKNTVMVTGSNKIGTTPIARSYYAIIGADVKADLEGLTRGADYEKEYVYQPAHKYASAASLAEGEVGQLHEVRFIEAESAIVYRGQGATAPHSYVGNLQVSEKTDYWSVNNDSGGSITLTVAAGDDRVIADGETIVLTETERAYAEANDATDYGNLDVEQAYAFDVFPILFPTEGAFATVGLKGLEKIKFTSKSPAQVENGNPYGTTGFFAYNFFYAGIILKEEALLKLLVAAKS
jgi:N4-gp56 family major capsid protein